MQETVRDGEKFGCRRVRLRIIQPPWRFRCAVQMAEALQGIDNVIDEVPLGFDPGICAVLFELVCALQVRPDFGADLILFARAIVRTRKSEELPLVSIQSSLPINQEFVADKTTRDRHGIAGVEDEQLMQIDSLRLAGRCGKCRIMVASAPKGMMLFSASISALPTDR